jgi:hypothetical protein
MAEESELDIKLKKIETMQKEYYKMFKVILVVLVIMFAAGLIFIKYQIDREAILFSKGIYAEDASHDEGKVQYIFYIDLENIGDKVAENIHVNLEIVKITDGDTIYDTFARSFKLWKSEPDFNSIYPDETKRYSSYSFDEARNFATNNYYNYLVTFHISWNDGQMMFKKLVNV